VEERPTLETTEPSTGRRLQLAFGYVDGAPMAALFVGDAEEPVLLPRDFLAAALEQGWQTGSKN
jgi:hypothetical protein